MYVLIATIFVAELIVVGFIVYWLNLGSKYVRSITNKVDDGGKSAVEMLQEFHDILSSAQGIVGNSMMFIIRKKHEIKQKITNLALVYLILIIFKIRFKKAATVLQYILIARDFWNHIPV